jgi:hypothetical protein
MAKKARPKRSAPKARRNQPVAKKAAPPVARPRATHKSAGRSATSKYDQPGAPWWKKFRPTETGATEPKR